MRIRTGSPKTLLRLAYEPESILFCLALLRFVYKFWDKSDYWSRWNIETEDSMFILVAAAAVRMNKVWSSVVAILICMFVLAGLYNRWLGNLEFVFAHYQHHLTQLAFGIAVLTCAVTCTVSKKAGSRPLP